MSYRATGGTRMDDDWTRGVSGAMRTAWGVVGVVEQTEGKVRLYKYKSTLIFLAAHVHPPTHFHVQNLDAPVLSSQTAGVLSSARHHHPPLPPTTMNSTQAFQLFRACRSAVPARGVTRTAAVAARRRAATAGVRYYSDKSSAAESSEAKAGGKEGEGDAGTPSATSECEEKLKKKEAEVVDLTVRCPASRLIVHR